MNKKVLLIKNITREGPGLLLNILKENSISYDLVDLDKNEQFPDPFNYNAIFVFGGPDSANDQTPKMLQELSQIKKATGAGIPYLGACLGLQTLVKANSGQIEKNPIKEIGWRDQEANFFEVKLTTEGKNDPLFTGLISPLKIFHLHGETVRLTNDMKLLATGKWCKNQIVKIGNNAYGIQGHFELTQEMFKEWLANDPDLLQKNTDELRNDYSTIKEEYEAIGKTLLTNFLKIAKIIL